MSDIKANPFPAEAVVTYPAHVPSCDTFAYMNEVRSLLADYLTNYEIDTMRYGGAFGIVGAHGSGKTHVLNWIRESVPMLRSSAAVTAYGKADGSAFFAVYRQLLDDIGRNKLNELYDAATRRVALQHALSSHATASVASRIKAGALQPLYEEGNLDQVKVENDVAALVYATPVDKRYTRTLLSVPIAGSGKSAFAWLRGDALDQAGLTGLGLVGNLLPQADATDGSAASTAALDALEAVAGLHKAAKTPLVILIDQLEVFMADVAEPATAAAASDAAERLSASVPEPAPRASILKKALEQLTRQDALVIIAGSDAGWRRLPRDVSARWRRREPIRVGELTENETGSLLDKYTHEVKVAPFPPHAVARINELSGGNPREALRIAFQAYQQTGGDIESIADAVLYESAERAGTIADRTRLCLATADAVLPEFGKVYSDVSVGSAILDRLVVGDRGGGVVALGVLSATDKVAETYAAQAVAAAQAPLATEWPNTPLITVAVGYSSAEVQGLLSDAAAVVEFRGTDFASRLRSTVAKAVAERQQRAVESEPARDFAPLLEKMAKQLAELQTQRKAEDDAVKRRLNEPLPAPPDGDLPYGKTRWDILDYLDALDEARNESNFDRERQLVKAVLVGNETGRDDNAVDRLGCSYLDLLSLASDIEWSELSTDKRRLQGARSDLTRDLRRVVRDRSPVRQAVRNWRFVATWVVVWIAVAALLFFLPTVIRNDLTVAIAASHSSYEQDILGSAAARTIYWLNVAAWAALAVAVLIPTLVYFFQQRRDRAALWEQRVRSLRTSLERFTEAPSPGPRPKA